MNLVSFKSIIGEESWYYELMLLLCSLGTMQKNNPPDNKIPFILKGSPNVVWSSILSIAQKELVTLNLGVLQTWRCAYAKEKLV